MKTLINSLQENTISRLNNPLIGAFVFSWTIWNISDVLVFLLSGTTEKITIIQKSSFELQNDLIAPLGVTLLYLVVVPIFNMFYERIVDGVINKYRNAFKQKTLQGHYYTVKRTTIAKLDSDEDENRKLRDRQLDKWAEEKIQMSATVINFRAEHAERMAKIDNEVSSYRDEIQRLTHEVYNLHTESEAFKQELKRSVRDVGTNIELLFNVETVSDSVFSIVQAINDSNNKAKKTLNLPIDTFQFHSEPPMDFDDDIPF